jgi:hypothetical protein
MFFELHRYFSVLTSVAALFAVMPILLEVLLSSVLLPVPVLFVAC